MNKIISKLLSLCSIFLTFSFTRNEVSIKNLKDDLSIYIEDNFNISKITSFYFKDENCYFVDLTLDNSLEKSVLISGDLENVNVYMVFNGNSNKWIIELNDKNSEMQEKNNDSEISLASATFSDDIIDSSKYFSISNISNNQYIYSSSYLNEVKLLNVPNYMNTQFNNMGCCPTSAAMFFAYLEDNGYSYLANNLDLPVSHTDDTSLVNNFIYYLGNSYFRTTNAGTSLNYISTAYENYLYDCGYSSYYCTTSTNYNNFYNSIYSAGLPVHITLDYGTYYHDVLGIGTKTIYNGTSNSYYAIVNFAYNDSMEEVVVSSDIIYRFYLLHC